MNPRTLQILEYHKILERVAARCAFSGGAELALALLPSDDLPTVRHRLALTSEAYRLLDQKSDIHFGGVRDVRNEVDRAARHAVLTTHELNEIKSTLLRARALRNLLTRLQDGFPELAAIAANIEACDHVAAEIARCINDRGEVVDSASSELAHIRSELRIAQERLMSTLERLVHHADIKPYLQDTLVTQRQGRYVIPVRSEYKGNIDGIVHDQSASGATLFIEPLKVVQQNNSVRQWELQEEHEIRRILTQLTELVADEADYLRRNVDVLAELDFIFAKAKYAYEIDGTEPTMAPFRKPYTLQPRVEDKTQPEELPNPERTAKPKSKTQAQQSLIPPITHPGSLIDLHRARHPLLDAQKVVPIDVYLDDETFIIVVTGPNTGGKTVTLKTVGLLALMAQSGLMLPVDSGSKLSIFEGVYADIGDEQSIEQSLSTFSGHLTNIITILEEADPASLVLLDELGAGTDPDEGSALAIALLDNLRDRSITTFATTHYSDLKLYAHNTTGVRNASVEFDVETLSPTYELSIGLPGRSNALTIARRLGLNPVIVDKAESIVRPDTLQADSLLADIKRAKQEALQAAERAKNRERQAQTLETDLRYQLASIEEARRAIIAETRELMQLELDVTRRDLEQIKKQLANARLFGGKNAVADDESLTQAEQALTQRRQETEIERTVSLPGSGEEQIAGVVEVGDRVYVPSLRASGEVLGINERLSEADVQLGNFRLKFPIKRLELRQKAAQRLPPTETTIQVRNTPKAAAVESPGIELDLRGARVEEGLEKLEQYLNRASLARLPWVRVIHGYGTGAMRNAVRDALRRHPLVSTTRSGEANEGSDGVTVVKLVSG
jgi:DNA mismatch repair protein MutS2